MLEFLSLITRSIHSRSWYRQVLNENAPIGFLYIFILKGVVAIFVTIIASIFFFAFFPTFQEEVVASFPIDLTVTIKDGKLSTNKQGPYIVNKDIVIDVYGQPNINEITKYKSTILITSDYIVSAQKNNKIEIFPIKTFHDVVIDQAFIASWVDRIASFAWAVPFIILFCTWIIGTLFIYFSSLFYAFLVWFILRIMKEKTTYSAAYSVTLYARTIPILLLFNALTTILVLALVTFLIFRKKQ